MELTIFDVEHEPLAALQTLLNGVPRVRVVEGDGISVTRGERLDAFIITLMQGERFGASPPFPLRQAFILTTPLPDVLRGLPRYMVCGVALETADLEVSEQLKIFLEAAFRAIEAFNAECADKISRVGLIAANLLAKHISIDTAVAVLRQSLRSEQDGQHSRT